MRFASDTHNEYWLQEIARWKSCGRSTICHLFFVRIGGLDLLSRHKSLNGHSLLAMAYSHRLFRLFIEPACTCKTGFGRPFGKNGHKIYISIRLSICLVCIVRLLIFFAPLAIVLLSPIFLSSCLF